MAERTRVVIIGGGFGGLYTARALGREDLALTVIDRRNYHLFQPLLYQVATAGLNPSDIARPIRSILAEQENTEVLLAEAVAIDRAARIVRLADGEVPYDYLVVAAGASHSYFGHDEWEKVAPGLKSIEDALEIRRRLLWAYEAAEREPDEALRNEWLTFVVVGAGPTGVEMAGAFAEIGHHTLRRDFRHIDPLKARVLLVEGLDRVLPAFEAALAPKAQRQLEKLGVEVVLGTRVTDIDETGVTLAPTGGGATRRIGSRTVMWAAGVAASPLARSLGLPLDRAGRVPVNPDLSLPGDDRVFVIGDLAAVTQNGQPIPGLAPAAMQAGRQTAANIVRKLGGGATQPYHYTDKGTLATIGRAAAVGSLGKLTFSGFIAWFIWAFIHLVYLSGFRNRLLVFLNWGWSYVTYSRGARLITGMEPNLKRLRATGSRLRAPESESGPVVRSP